MSGGLPKRWSTVPIEEIIEDFRPGFASGEKNVKGGVAHLRMNNIGLGGELVLDLVRTVPENLAKPHHDLRWGDVLVCTTNSGELVGKVAFFGLTGRYVFSNHLTRLRPKPDLVDGKFLRWNLWLHWKAGTFDDKCKHWVNQCALPKDALLETEIVLPPLPEQRRIVAKLEKLLAKVDACQKRLAKIPVLLKRFRQSVLAAACSGRLTAGWREKNQVPDEAEDNDRPAGWDWVRLEELLPKGGIFDGPFGSNLKTSDYTDSGVRVIRLENVGCLRFIGEKETYISQEKYETLKKHTVGEGDIIFASFIDEEIRACMLPKLEVTAIAKADCFCLRPKIDIVDRQYLTYQLVSRASYDSLSESVHGATRPRINTTQLRRLEVRMCSLGEQKEIVHRVEALFTLADQIEARCARANMHADNLAQSILAKAFRGELIPTEKEKLEPSAIGQ